ncbi:MAG: hypothetical protein MK213_02725 [Planctomycetes bacterium]|nr:hypothetical protein [Planctomycetota bacterium]
MVVCTAAFLLAPFFLTPAQGFGKREELPEEFTAVTPWMVAGPFAVESGADTWTEGPPENGLNKLDNHDSWPELNNTYKRKSKEKAGWEVLPNSAVERWQGVSGEGPLHTGLIDFTKSPILTQAGPEWWKNTAAYLYRGFKASKAETIHLFLGSDDGCKVWWNGKVILNRAETRGVNPHSDTITFRVRPGWNHILVKVSQSGGAWKYEMRPFTRPSPLDVDEAIDRGVEWLLAYQAIDGSWGEHRGRYRNGQTALSVYTLLKAGVPAEHPAVLRGMAFLQAEPATMTYSMGCQLLAANAMKDESLMPWIEEMVGDLISWQRRDGTWAYPTGAADLSCTQYAALGLWAAQKSGVSVPKQVLYKLIQGTMDHMEKRERERMPNGTQDYVAGFSYYGTPGDNIRGSMTAAGVFTLELCRQMLGPTMKAEYKALALKGISSGTNWIAKNFRTIKNPGNSDYQILYWLYGLERMGAILDTEFIGDHEWYPEGAWPILDWQIDTGNLNDGFGSWSSSQSETGFAILFLRRATRAVVTDSGGKQRTSLLKSNPNHGKVDFRLTKGKPLAMWVEDVGTTAAVSKVEYWERHIGEDAMGFTMFSGTASQLQSNYNFEDCLNPGSSGGWAVTPNSGGPHTAWFRFADGAEILEEDRLRVRLSFTSEWKQHVLGRYRLSVTREKIQGEGIGDLDALVEGDWEILDPAVLSSMGGADMRSELNGTIQVEGYNPATDVHEIVAAVKPGLITGVRIEAFQADGRPGVGRCGNGNIVMTGFEVERLPSSTWKFVKEVAAKEGDFVGRDNFSHQHTMPSRGQWEMKATVVLVDGNSLDSGPIGFSVDGGVHELMLRYATDEPRNLLAKAKPQVAVSSGAGANLVDNQLHYAWLCDAKDAKPQATIEMKRGIKTSRILFTHARTLPIQQAWNPKVTKVALWVNRDQEPIVVNIHQKVNHKTVYAFEEARSIRSLRVELLDCTAGEFGNTSVGFSEIEFQYDNPRRSRLRR